MQENKLKILICTGIYPPDIGGPATYSKLLFDELPKRGIEVEVLVFRKEVGHLPYVIRHIIYFFKILRRIKGVDIVFAQDPLGAGMPAGLAAKLARKKFILKIVGDRAWETGTQKYWTKKNLDEFAGTWFVNPILWPVKIGQNFVAWLANQIITPSEYLKKIIISWGVKADKIKVIYNAFDSSASLGTSVPGIAADKNELRKKFNLSGFVLVSVSRLVPWKGFGTLIEIMPEILKEIPEAKLVIIGSGPEKENLEFRIENLGLGNSVFLLGQLSHEEVLEYLKASDVFVLNTSYEGFSHLILEAMAAGAPIITTNVGGNPEAINSNPSQPCLAGRQVSLVREGVTPLDKGGRGGISECGILIEYNNKEQIKNAIVKLYKDKNLRDTLARNAQEKVKSFSKERMLGELVEFLKK